MRAVVDTNVVVSGLLSATGAPAQVLTSIWTRRLSVVLSDAILAEYRDVLTRPRLRIRPERAAEFLLLVSQTAEWVATPAYAGVPALPDPDDWAFVAAARAADCALITGNPKHFPAELGVRVMTAREWVEAAR